MYRKYTRHGAGSGMQGPCSLPQALLDVLRVFRGTCPRHLPDGARVQTFAGKSLTMAGSLVTRAPP
jgi:hypothetical protein